MLEFFNEHKIAFIITIAVVFIVEAIVMFFVAKSYRKKLNINAYNGGIIDFFGWCLIAFGILSLIEDNMLGIPMILIAVMGLAFFYYRNFKKYGKNEGLKLSLIQTFLCVGCLFEVAELTAFKKGQYDQFKSNYYNNVTPQQDSEVKDNKDNYYK